MNQKRLTPDAWMNALHQAIWEKNPEMITECVEFYKLFYANILGSKEIEYDVKEYKNIINKISKFFDLFQIKASSPLKSAKSECAPLRKIQLRGGSSGYSILCDYLNYIKTHTDKMDNIKNLFIKNFLRNEEDIETFIAQYMSDGHLEKDYKGDVDNRRRDNANTLKDRFKQWWGIDVNLATQGEAYNKLCDLFESISFQTKEPSAQNSDRKRKKTDIRWGDLFRKKQLPLDLFNRVPYEDGFGEKYRSAINDLLNGLLRLSEKNSIVYFVSIEIWHEILSVYSSNILKISIELSDNQYRIMRLPINFKESSENNLYLAVLLGIFKEKIYNDLRCFNYIIDNGDLSSMALNNDLKEVFLRFENYDMHTLDEIDGIIRENEHAIKQLCKTEDLTYIHKKVNLVFEKIIDNGEEKVGFLSYLIWMICCSCPVDYKIRIQHYGLKRGVSLVTLQQVIRSLKDGDESKYACQEVRMFFLYLAQCFWLINTYGEDFARKVIRMRKYISLQMIRTIRSAKSWREMERILISINNSIVLLMRD